MKKDAQVKELNTKSCIFQNGSLFSEVSFSFVTYKNSISSHMTISLAFFFVNFAILESFGICLLGATFFNVLIIKHIPLNFNKQGDSKRLTQRACTSCRQNGLNSKRRLNTRQTVGCGIPSSLLALRVHLRGLRSKLSSILLTFSSDTPGRPELLPLHRQPICSNW